MDPLEQCKEGRCPLKMCLAGDDEHQLCTNTIQCKQCNVTHCQQCSGTNRLDTRSVIMNEWLKCLLAAHWLLHFILSNHVSCMWMWTLCLFIIMVLKPRLYSWYAKLKAETFQRFSCASRDWWLTTSSEPEPSRPTDRRTHSSQLLRVNGQVSLTG